MTIKKSNTSIVIAILVAALLIVAAVVFAPMLRENVLQMGTDDTDSVERHIASQMIDPRSTTFRNMTKVTFGYCGEVNSKNKFGGYVGFKKFHAYKSKSGEWVVALEKSLVDIFCN